MTTYQNDLSERQLEAVNKLVQSNGGICWWKIGEGKTRLALAWAKQIIGDSDGEALVICSPNAFRQWQDEARKFDWSPRLRMVSYASLHRLQDSDLAQVNCVIIDELWLFKNVRTKRTISVGQITRHHPTLGLSGSMVTARNIEDIYGQTFAVNQSTLLARSLTNFRTQFCVSAETGYGMEFYAKRDAIRTIQQRLSDVVDIYFPVDTRESRVIPIHIEPTKQQLKIIKQLSRDYFTEIDAGIRGEQLEITSAAALIKKIQEVSDGILLTDHGAITSIESNKFKRLLELCEEFTDSGERAIIWFAFKASLNKVLERLGAQATALSSDHVFDSEGWADGKYQFCLATVGSGASLDDFANTERAVFYSIPFSPISVQQAKGRTNRKSTRGSIVYYHVLMTDQTIDQEVFQSVDMSGRIEQTIIRTSAEVLREYFNEYKGKNE